MANEKIGTRYTLEDLPDAMIKELSRAHKNNRDEQLFEILEKQFGGAASVDELWVALYRQTKQEIQRRLIGAAIRRLVAEGRIQNIPKRKGCYATPQWLKEHPQQTDVSQI